MNSDDQYLELTLDNLLSRVSFKKDLSEICLEIIENIYKLGKFLKVTPLYVGHEELNVRVETIDKTFVIKFFNKEKGYDQIIGNIDALVQFSKHNIPVPTLYSIPNGNYYGELPKKLGSGFYCVMDYFEGKTFNESPPTALDLKTLTNLIASMHNLKFETKPNYDIWIPYYFVEQFNDKKQYLSSEDLALLESLYDQYLQIKFDQLALGIGHFDLHKDNIKKDNKGSICFFDLATVDYNYTIIDLSAFIGFFMNSDDSISNVKEYINSIVDDYQKIRLINDYEKSTIPFFMKVIFAMNILIANYLFVKENDKTWESRKWYEVGKAGLLKINNL